MTAKIDRIYASPEGRYIDIVMQDGYAHNLHGDHEVVTGGAVDPSTHMMMAMVNCMLAMHREIAELKHRVVQLEDRNRT